LLLLLSASVYLVPWRDKGSQKTKKLGDFHSFTFSNSNLQSDTAGGYCYPYLGQRWSADYYFIFLNLGKFIRL